MNIRQMIMADAAAVYSYLTLTQYTQFLQCQVLTG